MSDTATVVLSPAQIDFYHQWGNLALDAITTPDEVAWLRGMYDWLFEQRAGRDRGAQFDLGGTDDQGKEARLPQIVAPSAYAPELTTGLFQTNAAAIARQLFGPDAETPWHQVKTNYMISGDRSSVVSGLLKEIA